MNTPGLETKVREAQRDISLLTGVQKGIMRDRSLVMKKYNKMSVGEVLKTAKQRLIALAARLKSYTRKAEAKRTIYKLSIHGSKEIKAWND